MKKKYFVFILFVFVFSFIKAQSFEEEASKKSCECVQSKLSTEKQITKEEINKCISQNFDEILKSKDQKEVKKIMKNMRAFSERVKSIYKYLGENCLPQDSVSSAP